MKKMYRWNENVKIVKYKNQVALFELKNLKVCKIENKAYRAINEFIEKYRIEEKYQPLLNYLIEKKYILLGTKFKRKEKEPFITPLPKIVYWEITNRCNLNCKTCFANMPNWSVRKREANLNEVKKIIKILKDIGIIRVDISGGEPLYREDIIEILKECEKVFPVVNLYSNGTLINEELAKKLKDIRIYYYQISLDGPTAEINDKIRGKGSFDKTIKGLYNLKKAGINNVQVKLTLTPENIEHIPQFMKFIKEEFGYIPSLSLFAPLGSAKINYGCEILNKCEYGLFSHFWEITESIVMKDVKKCIQEKRGFSEFIRSILSNMGIYPCGLGRKESFYISPYGEVYLCPYLRENEFECGNILEDKKWLKRWREFYIPSVDEIPSCKKCNVRYLCGGGCRGLSYAVSRSLFAPYPYCKFFKFFYTFMFWEVFQEKNLSLKDFESKILDFLKGVKFERINKI